jgi:hypothetical protein
MGAVRLLQHPFRVAPAGSVATVEQGSDEANAQLIATLILTRPLERPLVPAFGTPEPTFDGFKPSELLAAVAAWGPDVTISDVNVDPVDATTQAVTVSYA